ncbi:hypothetical protein ElyMa_006384700 [Elysia marginata]|uniref:Uncharacterized protein n=1 Tax=Elysia marginata TaxID=1093978 RepID=A0AAV4HS66_9GAST|nr:hypothetical protein ElyMa_006384700 [Elysia marginata]
MSRGARLWFGVHLSKPLVNSRNLNTCSQDFLSGRLSVQCAQLEHDMRENLQPCGWISEPTPTSHLSRAGKQESEQAWLLLDQ